MDNGEIVENVHLDQLVNVIDGMVERCDDYDKCVLATYSNNYNLADFTLSAKISLWSL